MLSMINFFVDFHVDNSSDKVISNEVIRSNLVSLVYYKSRILGILDIFKLSNM